MLALKRECALRPCSDMALTCILGDPNTRTCWSLNACQPSTCDQGPASDTFNRSSLLEVRSPEMDVNTRSIQGLRLLEPTISTIYSILKED